MGRWRHEPTGGPLVVQHRDAHEPLGGVRHVRHVSRLQLGRQLALPLVPPVLEPDLDLRLGQPQRCRQSGPFRRAKVAAKRMGVWWKRTKFRLVMTSQQHPPEGTDQPRAVPTVSDRTSTRAGRPGRGKTPFAFSSCASPALHCRWSWARPNRTAGRSRRPPR